MAVRDKIKILRTQANQVVVSRDPVDSSYIDFMKPPEKVFGDVNWIFQFRSSDVRRHGRVE